MFRERQSTDDQQIQSLGTHARQVELGVAGADPEAIGRFMLKTIGPDRQALINRCVSASRHLQTIVLA